MQWILARLTWQIGLKIIAGIMITLGGLLFVKGQSDAAKELQRLQAYEIQAKKDIKSAAAIIEQKNKEHEKLTALYQRKKVQQRNAFEETIRWKNEVEKMKNDPDYALWANSPYLGPE